MAESVPLSATVPLPKRSAPIATLNQTPALPRLHDISAKLPSHVLEKVLTDVCHAQRLNSSQMNAVRRSFQERLLLIHGPPGTGKTRIATGLMAASEASATLPSCLARLPALASRFFTMDVRIQFPIRVDRTDAFIDESSFMQTPLAPW